MQSVQLIVFLDDVATERWREPMIAAAAAAGLAIEAGAPTGEPPAEGTVVITDQPAWVDCVEPELACLVTGDPLPPLAAHPTADDRREIYRLSMRRAWTAERLRLGSNWISPSMSNVVLPALGEVTALKESAIDARPSSLEMFSAMPPPIGAEANWPPLLFSYQPEAFADGSPEIDMTGRVRILVHGPYIHLSAGIWRVSAEFDIDPEGRAALLVFRWGSTPDFEVKEVEIKEPGRYGITLEHEWSRSEPAQFVIELPRSRFVGRMTMHGCLVQRIGEPSPDVAEDHSGSSLKVGSEVGE